MMADASEHTSPAKRCRLSAETLASTSVHQEECKFLLNSHLCLINFSGFLKFLVYFNKTCVAVV